MRSTSALQRFFSNLIQASDCAFGGLYSFLLSAKRKIFLRNVVKNSVFVELLANWSWIEMTG
jgi:hypothetical protein